MYSTCLFCHAALGANQAIEHFPVGRRLAFDPAKGRLWAVCRSCRRWNLSPLDERWEAIEECERAYRGTTVRVQTDNIGLATLREGTELVRIGSPLWPEFASWRYGRQMLARRRGAVMRTAAHTAVQAAMTDVGSAVTITVSSAVFGVAAWAVLPFAQWAVETMEDRYARAIIARLPSSRDGMIAVRRRDLFRAAVIPGERHGTLDVVVPHRDGHATLRQDEDGASILTLLAAVNTTAWPRRRVQQAVDAIERAGAPEAYLQLISRTLRRRIGVWHHRQLWRFSEGTRLALEMAVHEEAERRAMQGELAALERAWRDAEEIAAIADNLLLPEGAEQRLDDMRDAAG